MDIRQTGVGGLRGVNTNKGVVNTMTPEQQAFHERVERESKAVKHGRSLSYQAPYGSMLSPQTYAVGTAEREYGKSKYDTGHDILPVSGFDELQQNRYDNQPWYDVAANGVAKAAGRAATSFITGVAGGLFGIGDFLYEGIKNDDWNAVRLIDNPLSNGLADLDEWADQNFVNYKSIIQRQNEENGEWYKNLTSLNTVMDDIVTNFGFIVGMGAASAVTGGIGGTIAGAARRGAASMLRAAKASGNMARIAAATKAAGIVQKYGQQTAKALTLINSSAGEAALEGITVKRKMMDEETSRINSSIDEGMMNDPELQNLDAQFQDRLDALEASYAMRPKDANYQAQRRMLSQMYQEQRSGIVQRWEQRRQAAMEELNQSAEEAGIATSLLNMAILLPSNFNMYGRLVDRSFRNAEKSAGNAWAISGGKINKRNALGQSNITGGIQGKSWNAIRNGKNYGSRTFLGNEAKRLGATAFSEGVYEEMGQSAASIGAEYYHKWADADNYWRARLDPDSINNVTDGSHDFLIALGQGLKESYGSIDGWREGVIGGITGGLFGMSEVSSEWKDTRFSRRSSKDLNKQLKSDKLPSLLQHMVAQSFHNTAKDGYAASGNQRDWKTEDDKAVFALVSSFDRAGRMDDLHYLINSYTDQMSDDDVDDLIKSSTRTVTSDDQIKEMKQEIRKNTISRIQSFLKDGATIDDVINSRNSVNSAQQALDSAEKAVQDARQKAADLSGDNRWLSKSEQGLHNIAKNARRASNRTLASDIVNAVAARDEARSVYERAKSAYSSMLGSPDSASNIEAILSDYDRLNAEADASSPEEYLRGPFVTSNGHNNLTRDEVRDTIKHNTDRIKETVERYREAIEQVNRDTRGILSKDQEDYLAYTQFMAESSKARAQELVSKWRGILPEIIGIHDKSAKSAAKRFGVSESEVSEYADNPGYFGVSTKNMTDEQFANFILHGLLKQSHVNSTEDDGSGTATDSLRKSLADSALDAIDRSMLGSGKRKEFDRDELRKDFDDIEDHFRKNKAFAEAYMEALSNPEGVMSVKDRWMRKLKKKYAEAKSKLNQKKMSVEELGDLSDDEMKKLDKFHFGLAKMEKIRRRLTDFWDSKIPDIYSRIEQSFNDIQDPQLRQDIINKVKERVNGIISKLKKYDNNEGPIDVDYDEISEMISLRGVFDDDDTFNSLDKKTKNAINKGLQDVSSMLRTLSRIANNIIRNMIQFFNKLAGNTQDSKATSLENLYTQVTSIIGKAVTSATDIDELRKLKKTIQDKIAELSSKNSIGNSAVVKTLKGLIDKINKFVSSNHAQNSPDSAPDNTTPSAYGQPSPKRSSPKNSRRVGAEPNATSNDVEQNPDLYEEEEEVNKAADSMLAEHININNVSGFPSNPWQTVTGELARRSGFAYETYHDIVSQELKKWDEKHTEPADNEYMEIDVFKPHGFRKRVSEWRRLAARSKIIHDRIKAEKESFGFIDSGKVKSGDDIRFLVTRYPEVGVVVYLVHEKDGKRTIIGDLTEPDPEIGSSTDPDLIKLWSALEKELDASGSAELLSEKYKTHVGNVYSGFLKYKGTDAAGRRQYSPVASLDGSDDVEFHICGTSLMYDDVFGSGKRGQPVVIVKRPGNGGLTRRVAVPVITTPFNSESIEAKVIGQAAKNLSESELEDFLKNFLHCSQVFITKSEVSDADTGALVTSYRVEVNTRNINAKSGKNGSAGERIKQVFTIYSDGTVSLDDNSIIRVNVSKSLRSKDNDLYKRAIAGNPELPKSYDGFLMQACQASVEDFNIHNSWVTVNPIKVNEDGVVSEKDITSFTDKKTINVKGNVEVTINDPANNLTYIVEFDSKSNVPTVVSIRGGSQQSRLPIISVKGANKADMLEKMAVASSKMLNSAEYDSTNSFVFQGIQYDYYLENSGAVTDIVISEDQPIPSKGALDAATHNELSYVARHFNGKNVEDIIYEFFDYNKFKNNPTMIRSLESLLREMKAGKTSYSIPFSVQASIVNAHKPITERARNVALALANRLKKHGINVIIDNAQGQARLDAYQEKLSNDGIDALEDSDDSVSYFVDRSGTVVYGFADHKADTPTIYLDQDLLNPETTIHEYTHLWVRCLRKANPDVWAALVNELEQKYPTVWNKVIKAYGKKVLNKDKSINRNKVADEVFAKITGEKYATEFLRNIGMSKSDSASMVSGLRKIYNKFINAVKSIFGKNLSDTLRDLVIGDMLSDNPLHNFGIIDEVAEYYGINEAKPVETQKQEEQVVVDISDSSGKDTIDVNDVSSPDDLLNVMDIAAREGIDYEFDMDSMTVKFNSSADRNAVIDKLNDSNSMHISAEIRSPLLSDNAEQAFEVLGETFIKNMKYLFNRGYGFDGIAPHVENMNYWMNRGRLGSQDFIRAFELLLSDEERNDIWDAALDEADSEVQTTSMMVARINNMFNSRLQGKVFNNPNLNTMFDVLAERIRNLSKNIDVVDRTESSFGEISSSITATPPTDPISNMSAVDRDYAYRESLMLLTDKEIETLNTAGFSHSLYQASSNDVKEWFRECVL